MDAKTINSQSEPYSIMWSHSQRCWHIEPLHEGWKKNLNVLLTKNWLGDYCQVAMVNSHKEADEIVDMLEKKMVERHGENWKEASVP